MFRKRLKNQKGFTLIELLVVVAIIGILAAVLAPNVFQATEKANISALQADIEAIKAAATLYRIDTGVWPPDQENRPSVDLGLVTDPNTVARLPDVPGWDGPYLERWKTRTPWQGLYTWQNGGAFNSVFAFIGLGDVPTEAAQRLEEIYDGPRTGDSDTTGVIRAGGGWGLAFIIAEN